jgi:hypothetical protein
MPGKKITTQLVEIYMENRKTGLTQKVAAAKTGICERSARNIDKGKIGNRDEKRTWITRRNPFAQIWESDIEPLLKNGIFQATYLLEQLQKKYPGKFTVSMLRTLQRKMKEWQALFGKNKEVMFRQVHEPGKLGISDFTHPKDIQITIQGMPFTHIFYHFRLAYSCFSYVQVFIGDGESYTAFAQGLQEALHYLGGAPESHRTDSLSASFKNLNKKAKEDLTELYKALAEHYGMVPMRINRGKSHENGAVESAHGHFKNRIRQQLIIRGNNDFASLEEYRSFVADAVREHNQKHASKIEIERAALKSLPSTQAADYTSLTVAVSCSSTIEVKQVTYTVPSRLIGEKLLVRIYNDKLECYLGSVHSVSLDRVYGSSKKRRAHRVDYRHVIESLVKKPGALRGWQLRDSLFPNNTYKLIWNYVDKAIGGIDACKYIVGVLHLAAKNNCEEELAQIIVASIKCGKLIKLNELQDKFNTRSTVVPHIAVSQHVLESYNKLIPGYQGANNG